VSGSEAEIRTVLFIEESFRRAGLSDIRIFGQKIQSYDAKQAVFGLPDNSIQLDGVPCWMSASTPSEGIEAESVYIGSYERVQHLDRNQIQGKIVITVLDEHSREEIVEAWKSLYSMAPAGVAYLDMQRDHAPRAYMNSLLADTFSKTPSMVISAKKTRNLHEHLIGSQVKMVVRGAVQSGAIQTIQCRLKGRSPDTVMICAHHDTHSLTPGATDDAAGVALVLELARILANWGTNLTYQFVSFGGEELGLKGSWAYASEVDLKDVKLCINIDSVGEVPAVLLALTAGSDEMIEWVTNIVKKNAYPALCRRTSTSGGDNKVFAAHGIPTIHLASYGTTTGKVSHSALDDTRLLTPRTLEVLGKFACSIIEGLDVGQQLPFSTEMPEDLIQAAKERLIDTIG
jgi:hypothetical protein